MNTAPTPVVDLVRAIHKVGNPLILAITGGGSGAVAELLAIPGASRYILEAIVPYATTALVDFLGYAPLQFCSQETAEAMARRAQTRASMLAPGQLVYGVACTASLATDRPKHGEHRIHLAMVGELGGITRSILLIKGSRTRSEEELVATRLILNLIAEYFGINGIPTGLTADEPMLDIAIEPTTWGRLLQGKDPWICQETHGRLSREQLPKAILSGSFNPRHLAHETLKAQAEQKLGLPVAYELSMTNVDKPPLDGPELRRRLDRFIGVAPVYLTRAPIFAEKAELFPGCIFVIGADTALRVVDPKYYNNSIDTMSSALQRIANAGCRFFVGGRVDAMGCFISLQSLQIPEEFAAIFTGLSEE